jgi:hypothetical protein
MTIFRLLFLSLCFFLMTGMKTFALPIDHIEFGQGWLIYREGLSEVVKNPPQYRLDGYDTYEFRLDHGGCPRGAGGQYSFNNCLNDRQRILAGVNFARLTKLNGKYNSVKKFYRTNVLIPDQSIFPDLPLVTTVINQVKFAIKSNPIWQMQLKSSRGEIVVELDTGARCVIDEKYFPRNQWIELEVHVDYTVQEKFSEAKHPYFNYIVNGKTLCSSYFPVMTAKSASESLEGNALYVNWGIYDGWVSDWLARQEKNKAWLKINNIELPGFMMDPSLGGGRTSSRVSKVSNPFDYDWPTKLPTRKLYYTDWKIADTREGLGKARFEWIEDYLDTLPSSSGELCSKAMPEWRELRPRGKWKSKAENQGLNEYICRAIARDGIIFKESVEIPSIRTQALVKSSRYDQPAATTPFEFIVTNSKLMSESDQFLAFKIVLDVSEDIRSNRKLAFNLLVDFESKEAKYLGQAKSVRVVIPASDFLAPDNSIDAISCPKPTIKKEGHKLVNYRLYLGNQSGQNACVMNTMTSEGKKLAHQLMQVVPNIISDKKLQSSDPTKLLRNLVIE